MPVPDPLLTGPDAEVAQALMDEEGYFQGHAEWGPDLVVLADTIRAITDGGLLPVFAFMYNEYWQLFMRLHHEVMSSLGSDYAIVPEFWAWNVDPSRGESGWKPHRDTGVRSLAADGRPKLLNVWIPLHDVTPLNGCMYIVPASLDPTHGTERDRTWEFAYDSIRALPAIAGDFFIWKASVVHWGGRPSVRAGSTRVSIALEFQRLDEAPFGTPLLRPLVLPSFDDRLRLIAKQVIQYNERVGVGQPFVEWSWATLGLAGFRNV